MLIDLLLLERLIMENLTVKAKKYNLIVNVLSVFGPAFLLFFKIFTKSYYGKEDISIKFSWLTPDLIIPFILFVIIGLALCVILNLNSKDLMQHDEDIKEVPRKFIHVYGLTAYRAVQRKIDYTKNVDLMLNNGFEMLSQNLYSCLITIIALIIFIDFDEKSPKTLLCLSFLIITSILYTIIFIVTYRMSNNSKRKNSEYLLLTICSFFNILSAAFFLILLVAIAVSGSWIPFSIFYSIAALIPTLIFTIFYWVNFPNIDSLNQYLESSDNIEDQL